MNDKYAQAIAKHQQYGGKIATAIKMPCDSPEDLALAYTPGVAGVSLAIKEDPKLSYELTNRANTIAVISDGSAVLGLGNIKAEAAQPVMEGKALLFKKFAGIDAIPLVLNTQDAQEIIKICQALEPSFAGINLEDISAPRCVEIERELIRTMHIPVFHDDQHGTAIVVLAALINALKLIEKAPKDCKVVVSGAGAAGSNVIKTLYNYGFKNIIAFDKDGCLYQSDKAQYDFLKQELLDYVNLNNEQYSDLKAGMVDADIFIGMSVGNIVDEAMIKSMSAKPIVFALANPTPEIGYLDAKKYGAYIVATGRSDFPNQVNNLMAFPYIFKGALAAKATKITNKAKMAAAMALASLISAEELSPDYIIPSAFDTRLQTVVSDAVKQACIAEGVVRHD